MAYIDDRYEKQRQQGYAWLRFAPDIEREYREDFIEMNLVRIRLAGIVGLASVLCFVVLDQFVGLNVQPSSADALLVALCLPFGIVPLIVTYYPQARPHVLRMIQLCVLAIGAGMLAVVVIGRSTQPWAPYESLLLVTAYAYFASGLLFYQAMAVGATLWVAFIASNWTLQAHDKLLYEAYYLLTANVLGWLGLYLLDRRARTEFLLRRELHHHAAQDPVTGLLNRRAFTAHLETAWLQAQRGLTSVGLMLLDVDHFKQVNDTCGHQFGDNVLHHVGQLLKGCALRPLDAAGRYGGDEVIAVWFGVDGSWLAKLAEDLPKRVEGLHCGDARKPTKVTISGGAVLAWPRPGLTVQEAVKVADELLYEQKRNARGRIGYRVLRPITAVDPRTQAA